MGRLFVFLCAIYTSSCLSDVTKHPNWHLFDHEHCGESVMDRIIGGTVSSLGQFPWMARIGYVSHRFFAIQTPPEFKCGAALINSMYVLTAAHCVTELEGEKIWGVRLGENNAATDIDCDGSTCAPPVQDFKAAKVIYHEKYQDPAVMRNDIALIRFDRPAQIHEYVKSICLPYGPLLTKNYVGTSMEIAGWGIRNVSLPQISDMLMHVRVPVVELQRCNKELSGFTELSSDQLCAGGLEGHDSCGGDSGGPLVKPESVDGPPKYFIIGVVSFGATNCGSPIPAIYTSVSQYMPWILSHIEP